MQRRQLDLSTYDDILAELDRLQNNGYQQLGQWTLGQICKHLSYYMRGGLEGFPFKLPWLVRKLIGRPLLKRALRTGHIPSGNRPIPASVFPPDVDEQAAVAEARELLTRLRDHRGDLHPSPLFDQLTADQWQTLNAIHARHHLSFLVPKS